MAGWIAGAIAGSAILGSMSASDAADTQAASAEKAINTQDLQYAQTRQDQMPFLQAGVRALGKLESAADYTPFGMDQFNADPGYAFRLSEGQKALDRSAAARGGLISGSALKAATRFGQDMGSQEYTNAFNRYQAERAAKLAPLQSLAGVGVTTAQSLGQTGASNAANVGNLMTGAGAAQAAGMVGGANALTGGLSSYINYNQGNNLVNALRGGRIGGGYNPSSGYGAFGGASGTFGEGEY
jgi:hypothetical protein